MGSSNIINQFNDQWRQSPLYQQGLQAVGEPTNGPITLNGGQRDQLLQFMKQHGVQVPQGATIDGAGNANEPEGFGHYAKKYGPIVGGAALTAFGIPGVMPGLLGLGGGAAAAPMSLTQLGMNATPGLSSTIGGGVAGAMSGGTGAGVSGIGGFLSGLGKKLGGDFAQRAIGSAGSALAGGSQAAANNRGVALDAEQQAALMRQRQQEAFENQLLQRSQDDRESLTDAFTKSVQADRVANSQGYKPASLNLVPGQGPSQLPSFGTGMAAPSQSLRDSALAMNAQVQPRLTQGSQLPALQQPNYYQNDPKLMHAGAGEKIGSWLGPALSFAGAYRQPAQQPSTDPYGTKKREQ